MMFRIQMHELFGIMPDLHAALTVV